MNLGQLVQAEAVWGGTLRAVSEHRADAPAPQRRTVFREPETPLVVQGRHSGLTKSVRAYLSRAEGPVGFDALADALGHGDLEHRPALSQVLREQVKRGFVRRSGTRGVATYTLTPQGRSLVA